MEHGAQVGARVFHQLPHIPSAAGNGVVEIEEGLALLATGLGFFADGGLQVVNLAAEALFQAQMQRPNEGGLAGLIPEVGAWQEEAQRF